MAILSALTTAKDGVSLCKIRMGATITKGHRMVPFCIGTHFIDTNPVQPDIIGPNRY